MKFAEGHWVMRRGVRAAYAADAYETRVESERLTIIAATQILKNRGMTIGGPTITLRISSPLAGVLCFDAAHFLGAKAAKPEFALHCERPQVCVREDGFQSAHIAASIGRNMQIAIASGGERITGMGFRSLGVMDDENTGKRYLSAQLDLDVGECIYGLGERFTPFVKNGQSVDLTAKEFDLMELLMRNPGRVYSRENLLNIVWGYEYAGEYRTVDVHIRRLREKLEQEKRERLLAGWKKAVQRAKNWEN